MKPLLALATLALLAACGGDGTGPAAGPGSSTASVTGTWYLATINGFQLPVEVQTDSGRFRISEGVLSIPETASWSETTIGLRFIPGGGAQTRVRSRAGTATRSGATVTLRSTTGTTAYQGTVTATQLHLTEPVTGFPFVFVHAIPSQ